MNLGCDGHTWDEPSLADMRGPVGQREVGTDKREVGRGEDQVRMRLGDAMSSDKG
jgi:hypothetical protein